jgi:hypothetical protein
MRDHLFVSFFLGHDAGSAARRLLHQCNLLETALNDRGNRHSWLGDLHTGVSIRLPFDDPRLHELLNRLSDFPIDPFTRLDREYSRKELDAAEWLTFRVSTTGLSAGVDYGQAYDVAAACAICGAGAQPRAPLIADLGSMGRKDIDHCAHEGHLIVSSDVAEVFGDLTGIVATPVRSPRRTPDTRFAWLRIQNTLPKMHAATRGYTIVRLCPRCNRSGHYCSPIEPEAPCYAPLPPTTPDFNLTWECFGDWRPPGRPASVQPVGGSQRVIVSQRVRQRFLAMRVRNLQWVPVTIVADEM